MYIPLDNLYEWIAGNFPGTLIYRFFPHGSKNLGDLQQVDCRYGHLSWHDFLNLVPVICHDQEPLNYSMYQKDHQQLKYICQTAWPAVQEFSIMENSHDFWQHIAQRNMAGILRTSLADRAILLHSEVNSVELDKYQDVAVGAYWWSHAAIARDWYRFAQHDIRLPQDPDHDFSLDFNIYARAWSGTREYRLALLHKIMEAGLVDHSRISFNPVDQNQHYSLHQWQRSEFACKPDLSALGISGVGSFASATYDHTHYQQCAFDLVLETLFDDSRIQLTEKILRPIACGQPFILAATPGSLEYLRGYGFQTFGHLIDESYDQVQDPVSRMNSIVAEMQRIAQMSAAQKKQLWQHALSVAQYNKQHFFSERFIRQVTNELYSNVGAAYEKIATDHRRGQTWLKERSLYTAQQRREINQYLANTFDGYRSDCAGLLRQLRSSTPSHASPGGST
jgi:hypothetical protein